MFDSAASNACLAALLKLSYAELHAATAFLNNETSGSEPAGAFRVANSTNCAALVLPSAIWFSTISRQSWGEVAADQIEREGSDGMLGLLEVDLDPERLSELVLVVEQPGCDRVLRASRRCGYREPTRSDPARG